jgi:hypothetical protein
MANFVYNEAKNQLLRAGIDFTSADIRVLLVMTNTTADTEDDVNTIGALTTLDEYDGSGYSAGGAALTGETVVEDAGNNRAYFDASDVTFTALGAGTRQCQGALLYKFVSSVSASLPIGFIDTGGFPFTGNGSNVTLQWNAAGILQAN